MKKVLVLVVILLFFMTLLFVTQTREKVESEQLKVTVSTFGLYDIVKHIGGESVDVQMLIPFGVDVHSFEPTPKTIINIQKSKLFFYSGAALEPWIEHLAHTDKMRDMSLHVKLLKVEAHDEEEHEHHGVYDPHYWLDVDNMVLLTETIKKALIENDSVHRLTYQKNAERYIVDLERLDKAYKDGLQGCHVNEVILHHNILGYVAHRYGFSVETLTGLSPDALADAKTMARLSNRIKAKSINVVFFEAFVSNRLMQSLASENGIKLAYLEPLANITAEQAQENMSYVDGMMRNLVKLQEAMQCQ